MVKKNLQKFESLESRARSFLINKIDSHGRIFDFSGDEEMIRYLIKFNYVNLVENKKVVAVTKSGVDWAYNPNR